VAFTPTQVEAIRAGMHYGLTMVGLMFSTTASLSMYQFS